MTQDKDKSNSQQLLLSEHTMAVNTSKEENETKQKYVRKPDYCYFCETEVFCFGRHIIRNHASECEVQKILSFPPKDKERKKLIKLIRNRGNYSNGIFKPVRSSSNVERNVLPCINCLGFFSSKLLYRHRKVCAGFKGNAQSDG